MESIQPFLADLLKVLAGSIVTLIPFAVKTYRDRKKSRLEDEETAARTDLARTTIRSTAWRDDLAAGEGVGKLLSALIDAGDTIHDLQNKNFRLEQEAMGREMLWLDLQKASALLAYHSIPFHNAEHPAVKRLVEKLAECEPPYPQRSRSRSKDKSKESKG